MASHMVGSWVGSWYIVRQPRASGWGTMPRLHLDVARLLAGDMAGVLAELQKGLATTEHAAFVERLRAMGNVVSAKQTEGKG